MTKSLKNRKLFYQPALKEIEQSVIAPAYLLYGEEVLLADKLIEKLKNKFLGKADPELNYFVRYATESGVDAIITLGSGTGLFSDKKMIVLKEAHTLKQADLDRLKKFMEKQTNDICLILQTHIASIYQTRLMKIEPFLTSVNLLPLRAKELDSFIQAEFKKNDKRISPAAIEMLLFLVGTQLSDLIMQINNLGLFFSEKANIDVPEIEQITGIYVTQDVFEFTRLIGRKNLQKAFFVLHNLLDTGVSPQQIITQLLRHFSLLWRIQGYYRSGIRSKEVISKKLRIYSKYYQEYAEQSRQWHSQSLKRIFMLLHKADFNLKDSSLNPKITLDILSQEIINCQK